MRVPASPLNRRRFMFSSAVAATAFGTSTRVKAFSTNDRLKLAFIGVGGRGGANLRTLAATQQIDVAAICDVDSRFLDNAAELFPAASKFRDFRKLYDAVGNDVDGVVVSTAEHTHAYATMPALQLGKHVYCEKPLAYNVDETRQITVAAAKANVATQMGTQIHAGKNYHQVVELIQSGVIGAVSEVHVWVSRAWGLQSEADAKTNKDRLWVDQRPSEPMTPPEFLDWDLWLGPAPERPFHEVYFPGPNWYRWWDFGNGTMSDLGSHWNDLPFWALNLDAPRTVEAFGPDPHPEIAPASMNAVYEYGPRGNQPAVTLTWHQGSHKPEIWKRGGIPKWSNGVLFIGSKGMLLSDYGKYQLLPEDRYREFQPPALRENPPTSHHHEWLAACRGEGKTGSPFSYAGPLTEANHLGNVAFRVGKKIEWDSKNMNCKNCPEAQPFLKRTPREGWSLS